MKEGLAKKARQAKAPFIAKQMPGARPSAKPAGGALTATKPVPSARQAAKPVGGALPAAKPLPAARKAPTSTSTRSLLKPLKDFQSHLRGAFGHPRPTPILL